MILQNPRVVSLLTLFFFVPMGCSSENPEVAQSGTSYGVAADFSLVTLEGDTFRMEDHRGKVILLNFWATWCIPCRVEVPDFVELQDEFGTDGLLIVGVSLDQEGFEAVRPFAEEFSVNYPMVVDDGSVAHLYGGVSALPTTFLIGRDGVIRNRVRGLVSKKVLRPVLTEMLNEPADAGAEDQSVAGV